MELEQLYYVGELVAVVAVIVAVVASSCEAETSAPSEAAAIAE